MLTTDQHPIYTKTEKDVKLHKDVVVWMTQDKKKIKD